MIFTLLIGALLPITDIELKGEKLTVEIAHTEETRAQGLMNRYDLEQNKGMLFIFDKPEILSFWMKNTKIPLSIAFFDETKKLINILDMSPPPPNANTYPTYQSKRAALYALEVNQGWFADKNIQPPMKFAFLDCLYSLQ